MPARQIKTGSIFLLAGLLAMIAFTPAFAVGWFSPSGTADASGQWANGNNAVDSNTVTYAAHTSPGAGQWGAPLWLTNTTTFKCGRVKVYSDWDTSYIDKIRLEIRIQPGGTWSNVYEGSVLNCNWSEITFASTNIDAARYSYHYVAGAIIFWLYEFQFYADAAQINSPSCNSADATSVEETSGILHGNVIDDGGEPCQFRFQYGLTTSYSTNTAWGGSLSVNSDFSTFISGLATSTTYHFRAQVKNGAGIASGSDKTLLTGPPPSGWVAPMGYTNSGGWTNILNAFDDDLNSFSACYHNINDGLWSTNLFLTHSTMTCERVRFNARHTAEIDASAIDVDLNGVWTNVYSNNTYSDKQWFEASFPRSTVTQARIKFSVTSQNFGMDWQLYEFEFYRAVGVTLSGTYDGAHRVSLALDGQYKASFTNFTTNVFTFAVSLGAGSRILLFYDDDDIATNSGALVTKATGNDMTNLDLTVNTLIVRNDYGSELTSADMAAACTNDADVPYRCSGNNITVTNNIALRIPSGKVFTPGTNSLTLYGNLINDGTLNMTGGTAVFSGTTVVSGLSTTAFGNVTITGSLTAHSNLMQVAGNWVKNGTFSNNNGTVEFNGNTPISGTTTTSFKHITISGTLTAPPTMNVAGSFVNNGAFNHNNGTVVFNGTSAISGTAATTFSNVTVAAGSSLTAPGGSLYVSGNWSNGGIFSNNNGTVVFNGLSTASITGSNTFYNFTCTTPGKQINFAAQTNQTVLGTFTISGNSGSQVLLRSASGTNKWLIVLPNGAQTVTYADVKDSDALSNAVTVVGGTDSGNNNTNWIFAKNRYWVGGNGNWSDTNHWALTSGGSGGASVPDSSHFVIFDTNSGASAQCTINRTVGVNGIVMDTANTVTLNQGTNAITLTSAGFQEKAGVFTGGSGFLDTLGAFQLSGGVFTAPSNSLNLRSDFTHSGGIFSNNNGTVVFAGSTIMSDPIANPFANLTISNSVTAPTGALYVTGNWTDNGVFNHNTGTVVFSGATTISGVSTTRFRNVTISGSVTGNPNTISVAGAWVNNGAFNPTNGTVLFPGTTEISGSSTSSFNNVTITGSLTAHASKPVNVGGNWVNSGTFNHNGGTVVFCNSTAISGTTISAFNNVTIQNALIAPTGTMKVAGNWVNSGAFSNNNGRVIFNGVSALSGTNATSFCAMEIWGQMTAPATNLYVSGDWINHGTFSNNNGTVVFNGTTLLSGANASDFNSMMVSGAVTLAIAERIGDASAVTVPGTLSLGGNNETIGSLAGTGQVLLGTAVLTIAGNASTNFGGSISQNGSIVKQGSGTLTLSGTNTYVGDTRVEAGVLKVGAGNALSVASTLRIGNTNDSGTARFDLAGFNQQVAGLTTLGTTMQRMVTNTSGTLVTLTVSNDVSGSYAGLILGNVSLAKAGAGTLTLGGTGGTILTNTYPGATVVSNGVLAINTNSLIPASTSITVLASGQLTLGNTNNVINDSAGVYLQTGGKLYLTNGVNETVSSLYFDGAIQASGTWGTVNCQWTNTDFFAGSGKLNASTGVSVRAITASAGPNGAIVPTGIVYVVYGGATNFVMTPDADYHIADVLVDGASVGATNGYTFASVTSNRTISVSFAINTVVQITNTLSGARLPFRATSYTLAGRTVNVTGNMWYTNSWAHGTNTGTFAAATNWTLPLALPSSGTYGIAVYGTNAAGGVAHDSVIIVRERNQVFWLTR